MSEHDRPNPRAYRDATRRTSSITQARSLRADMTVPEVVLWQRLRRGGLGGLRFRRQHPLGPYIADFYCHECRLVVEADSGYHDRDQDNERDHWMKERGIRVVRVTAGQIAQDLEAVLRLILREAEAHRADA